MQNLTITRPDDWHLHLRDGTAMQSIVNDSADRFARAIIMPNLLPAVTTVEMAEDYRQRILESLPAGSRFQPLMTIYLTENTTPAIIHEAADSENIFAVKYYPAGATTNSENGVTSKIFDGDYLVKIFKVVYLNQENLI